MGITKRMMEEEEGKLEEAQRIALQAGAIQKCMVHSDVLIATYDPLAEERAYKIGVARFRDKELWEDFRDYREVTDKIQEAIESAVDLCPSCAKD